MEIIYLSLFILLVLAILDLIVGVANDAVNFLNSAIGSKVASIKTILIVASLGILAGVTFSSGMMEIARKGIFNPSNFVLYELIIIFLAVMLADVILLDLFNTFGIPTSTTVSIIFELLGASVALSLIKIFNTTKNYALLGDYINTDKVLGIISGILLSVIIAFTAGVIFQFISRMIFTFDFMSRLKRYGAIWGGFALSMIVYFILIKGAKGASFLTAQQIQWIQTHSYTIILGTFICSAVVLQITASLFNINILKSIVLAGTFALAMAFAANDLVNFIGVPLAGFSAFSHAKLFANPLTVTMEALNEPVKTNTFILLLAGIIMAITLWVSKKARTVTKTEVNLGRQDEGLERFEPFFLARVIVRMTVNFIDTVKIFIPKRIIEIINKRKDIALFNGQSEDGRPVSFDLIRASVNLVVSSALIAFATSLKLPLSTTYVTFMVAMGTSLADGAWDRESAVYRVSGVMTVIGGWFFTAFMAFTISFVYAMIIYKLSGIGIILLVALSAYLLWKNHIKHEEKTQVESKIEVYNLRKIKDPIPAIKITFEQTGKLLEEISKSVVRSFNGLKLYDRVELRIARNDSKNIQEWVNIIVANIFKTLRLLHKMDISATQRYAQIISNLQDIAESQRDIAVRSYLHVENHHKGLLKVQITELEQIIEHLKDLLNFTAQSLKKDKIADLSLVEKKCNRLAHLISEFDKKQIRRVQDETSKTRLSILFYAYLVNASKIANCTKNILQIFNESLDIDVAAIPEEKTL
ncbi:MAG: inorganic phosphate transporter [Spirochaetes bacterium]|nr:inorganic phosphate transporter [Spirochaetota bacterium]